MPGLEGVIQRFGDHQRTQVLSILRAQGVA
jgi:hypothetical protein